MDKCQNQHHFEFDKYSVCLNWGHSDPDSDDIPIYIPSVSEILQYLALLENANLVL